MQTKGTKRICENGHVYYKSSACPVCPVCESMKKPENGLFAQLSAPARRGLQAAGIIHEHHLRAFTPEQIEALHGIGPSAMKLLMPFLKS